MTQYYPGIWFYDPSIAGAVIFGLLFLALTVIHTYQFVRTRTWHWIPFVLGGYCETAGYISRAVGAAQNPAFTLTPYIVNAVLVLVAPALFAASMYMDLRKIVRLTEGEKLLPMSAKLLTPIFVIGDFICFILQFAGAGALAGQTDASITLGNHIIIIGLVLQIVVLILFIAVSVTFEGRMNTSPTARVFNDRELPWQKHTYNLYTASIIIILRCTFRIAQYARGNDYYWYLVGNEWCAFIFDGLFMLMVMMLFGFVHPSEVNALLRGHGTYVKHFLKFRQVKSQDRMSSFELPIQLQQFMVVQGQIQKAEEQKANQSSVRVSPLGICVD